jgi:RNA polymerase sigma-70 factor (ECF subfamily)
MGLAAGGWGGYHVAMDVELEIRELLGKGEQKAAATLAIKTFGPKILGYLRSILKDEGDASEAFSIFAENLWRGLPKWRGESAFKTWAYKLAWNAAINMKDEAWRRKGRRFETSEASRIADEVRTRSVVRVERQRRALDELRAELNEEEQTMLVLRIDQGLAWEAIGEVLAREGEVPDTAALRKRFERLKDRLAKRAKERGLVQ